MPSLSFIPKVAAIGIDVTIIIAVQTEPRCCVLVSTKIFSGKLPILVSATVALLHIDVTTIITIQTLPTSFALEDPIRAVFTKLPIQISAATAATAALYCKDVT
jgi:hypothetical protein